MVAHDAVGRGQAEPGPLALLAGGEERLEGPIQHLLGHTLAGVGDISYTDYGSRIAVPVRDYLTSGVGPTAESIIAICLLRPIPHRIRDTDYTTVGDLPAQAGTEFENGDATYASVDCELTLLFQHLTTGEAGGRMDSLADNCIDNPYHGSTAYLDPPPPMVSAAALTTGPDAIPGSSPARTPTTPSAIGPSHMAQPGS